MAHTNTLLQKVKHEISRHVFDSAEKRYFQAGDARKFSNKNLFTFWLYVHIKATHSLRGAVESLNLCIERLYHLGFSDTLKRSTISDAIRNRTHKFFEDLFFTELAFTKRQYKNKFAFPLRILDSTEIVIKHIKFAWEEFKNKKNMFKIHMEICGMTSFPLSVDITSGKVGDITHAKKKMYEPGTILLMDRAYFDTGWWIKLNHNGVLFITRRKEGIIFKTINTKKLKEENLVEEKIIQFMGDASQKYNEHLRCVSIYDKEKNEVFDIITNEFDLPAKTIAALYKQRWQIELFFKWLKQHLKIKHFVGLNSNAMLMQVWTAMLTYLLIWRMHKRSSYKNRPIFDFLRYLETRLLLPDIQLRLFPPRKKIPIQWKLF